MTSRRGSLREATADWRSAKSAVLLIGGAALLATVPGLVVPMLMRGFLNQVLVLGNDSWEAPVLIGLFLCAAVSALLVWLQWRTGIMVAARLSAANAAQLVWHLLRLPTADIERFGAGALTARVSALQLRAYQAGVLMPLAFVNALVIVVYAAFLLALNYILGVAALIVVLVSISVTYLMLSRRSVLQDEATQGALGLASATTGIVTEIETIKAAAAEQRSFATWSQLRTAAGQATSNLEVDAQRLGLISPITQAAGLGVVLAIGTVLVFQGALDLGTLVASQGVLAALLVPAGQIVWLGVLLESVANARRYADEIEALPLDIEVTSVGEGVRPTGSPLALHVRNVDFGYDEQPLFEGLELEVPAGAWVAVVGGSGSGKSTLARLCVGELQPWSGAVLLDGVPRLEAPRAWRSAVVGYVPQYPTLVPGTIVDNIRMFEETVSEDQVVAALTAACVMDAIDRRPSGLYEQVGATGHGFSGGELQRLAIARALVRSPGLLVLDEATSALDPIVELELEQHLRELSLTCLVVAHRLSTVRDADEIVVLEQGRIVQRGAFDALRSVGRFQELVHG